MDIINLIIDLLTLFVIFILVLLGRNYLSSYFDEKGKNLATKEDIEEVTDRIERVRIQYASEIEMLRSELAQLAHPVRHRIAIRWFLRQFQHIHRSRLSHQFIHLLFAVAGCLSHNKNSHFKERICLLNVVAVR